MSQPDETTPLALAANAFEVALIICGLWLLWRLVLSPGARARREVRLAEWRLPPIDFACFVGFGIVGAIAVSGVGALAVRHSRMGPAAATIIGSALADGGFLLGIAGFHFTFGARVPGPRGPRTLGAAHKSGLVTFLISMPIVVAVGNGWDFALRSLSLPDEKQELVNLFENTHSAVLRWVFLAVAVLIAPAAEEFLFRGGLFRYFRTRMPRWVAIILTSALFGAPHVSWADHMAGLPSFLPLIALAAVFCLAYERTGMIGTVIVAHALFNLNSMLQFVTGIGS